MTLFKTALSVLTLHGKTLTDEVLLIKNLFLIFVLGILNNGSFALFEKKYLFNHRIMVSSMGVNFCCRSNSIDLIYVIPLYERDLFKYFQINKGIFLDVGAHIGRYSLLVANNPRSGSIYSFEPTQETYYALKTNVSLNCSKKVLPKKIALSNKKGVYPFFKNHSNDGENSLLGASDYFELVQSDALDNFLENEKIDPNDVALVKIDVEGAEELVLQGAINLLAYGAPNIVFESNSKFNLQRCNELLTEYGYSIKRINRTNFFAEKKA